MINIKAKLIYNQVEKIIEVQDNVSEEDIESMFSIVFNVQYDKNTCSYEAINGRFYSLDEILAYTE